MSDYSDEKLASLAATTNLDFFSELYERYIDRIYRYVFISVRHKESAEDISSKVFTKALSKISSFNPDVASFKAWLYSIAHNSIIDHYRVSKKEVVTDEVPDVAVSARVESIADTNISLAKIQSAVGELDNDLRQIITLRLWEEMSFAEISKLVGKSEGAVKMQFYRGVSELRKLIVVFVAVAIILFVL